MSDAKNRNFSCDHKNLSNERSKDNKANVILNQNIIVNKINNNKYDLLPRYRRASKISHMQISADNIQKEQNLKSILTILSKSKEYYTNLSAQIKDAKKTKEEYNKTLSQKNDLTKKYIEKILKGNESNDKSAYDSEVEKYNKQLADILGKIN